MKSAFDKNFSLPWKWIIIAILAGLSPLLLVNFAVIYIFPVFATHGYNIEEGNFFVNFNTIAFVLYTTSIGYPITAQFIRYTLDDWDGVIKVVNDEIKKESKKEISNTYEISFLYNQVNDFSKHKNNLRQLHAFSEFKPYIVFSFIFLLSSALHVWANNSFSTTGFLLQVNLFFLGCIITFSILVFIKISIINKFLNKQKRIINDLHDHFTKPDSEKIMEIVESQI